MLITKMFIAMGSRNQCMKRNQLPKKRSDECALRDFLCNLWEKVETGGQQRINLT